MSEKWRNKPQHQHRRNGQRAIADETKHLPGARAASKVGLTALAVVLLTVGCGTGKDAHYDSAEDLRQTLVDEDLPCHGAEADEVTGEVDMITCDTGYRIYTWEEGADEALAEVMRASATREPYYVISDTWVVTASQQGRTEGVQDALGGELHGSDAHRDYLGALQLAHDVCLGRHESTRTTYDPDYDVMTINGAHLEGFRSDPATNRAWTCVKDELPIPGHVQSDISRTRALDGTREASWDDFSASWTYHPDSGLNIQIEQAQ